MIGLDLDLSIHINHRAILQIQLTESANLNLAKLIPNYLTSSFTPGAATLLGYTITHLRFCS